MGCSVLQLYYGWYFLRDGSLRFKRVWVYGLKSFEYELTTLTTNFIFGNINYDRIVELCSNLYYIRTPLKL